jgi:hypothetical protein
LGGRSPFSGIFGAVCQLLGAHGHVPRQATPTSLTKTLLSQQISHYTKSQSLNPIPV